MKNIFLIFLTVCISLSLQAQYKVKESSQKRMPEWVTSVTKDYLNVSATGATIEEAKASALASVKQQIIESIASRVIAETDLSRTDVEVNGEYNYAQSVKTNIYSMTAKMPFLGELSLSKVSNYYWEQRFYKESRSYEYFYAVQYPFSDFDMKKLVMDFNLHNKQLDEKLSKFESNLKNQTNINSIEDIDVNISNLKAFSEEFTTLDPRYIQINNMIAQYRKLYDYISMYYYQNQKGVIAVSLSLSGKDISTQQKPILKSNCATKLSSFYEGNVLVINYDDFSCYPEDENYIDVRYKTGNKYITERIPLNNIINISISGIVTDADSGEPISYAEISILPSKKVIMTNKSGMYQFNDLPGGTYTMQVMKKGYSSIKEDAAVTFNKTLRKDFKMSKKEVIEADRGIIATNNIQNEPIASKKEPANTIRNGLYAYYRFNGSFDNAISSQIKGQGVNESSFVNDSKDGTKSLKLSAANDSYVIFPKGMIKMPIENYSITFWAKGLSNGHIFTNSVGTNTEGENIPRLEIIDGKLKLIHRYDDDINSFSHNPISYDWHFIGIVVSKEDSHYTQALYIDGEPIDVISFNNCFSIRATKFILGGPGMLGGNSLDMYIDNLRFYNARALTEDEIQTIYRVEQ